MKLISLNTWAGKVFEPLASFVKEQMDSTDIFCFQEISSTDTSKKQRNGYRLNLLADLKKILKEYNAFFVSEMDGVAEDSIGGERVDFDLHRGNAIFVKKSVVILSQGDFLIFKGDDKGKIDYQMAATYLQYINIDNNGKKLCLGNFHGTYYPGNKLDTPNRLRQSQKLKKFVKKQKSETILCGDFNLMPETKSVALLEVHLRNLIKEFNIQETRGKLNLYYGKPKQQHFSSYIFVSKNIRVLNFQVPDVEISDHLPIILEFEV